MRRILCAVLLVLLVAACGSTDPGPVETPTPTRTPTPTPTPTPAPTPAADVAPLTGLPVDDPALLERPVIVVKVDNLAPARPQSGLEDADLTMVQLVEGATRFAAFFQSTDPGVVGPVRSGRLAEADLLPPFDPIFLISGAAQAVWPELRGALSTVYEEGQTPGWFRDGSRRAPHNLYVTVTDVWAQDHGHQALDPFWTFDAGAPVGGSDVTALQATYPRAGTSGWEWDADAGRWLRLENGTAHVSAADDRLAADNVVVVRMEPTGAQRRPFEPIGEGEATVFRDGQQFEARWNKASRDDHIELLTPDGDPFPLKPGQTWMELLPTNGSLNVDTAG